jgi:hypothetical protein
VAEGRLAIAWVAVEATATQAIQQAEVPQHLLQVQLQPIVSGPIVALGDEVGKGVE